MRVVPPPAHLLVRKDLLPGVIRLAALRQSIAFRPRDDEAGAIGIVARAQIVGIGVEPIELLAALDIGLQIGARIQRRRAREAKAARARRCDRPCGGRRALPVQRIEPAPARRPVAERQVIVEGDKVDIGRSPEGVQMRPLSIGAGMLKAHPRRPVGGIGDEVLQRRIVLAEARAVEHAAHVGGELREARDERIVPHRIARAVGRARLRPARAADRLQPAKFRADDEQIDPARDDHQVRVMQDHPPIGPIGRRARIAHRQVRGVARELRRRRAA